MRSTFMRLIALATTLMALALAASAGVRPF